MFTKNLVKVYLRKTLYFPETLLFKPNLMQSTLIYALKSPCHAPSRT